MTMERDPSDEQERQRDLDLVRGSLEGDKGAITSLVARLKCVPRILLSINRRMGNRLSEHDLADLSQDTLIVIWGKLGSFRARGRFESWVYRFCFLEFMNRLRRTSRYSKLAGARLDGLDEIVSAPTRGTVEDFEQLDHSLSELGSPEADVIRLKHFEERTFADIGTVLNISPNSAKTCYYRGLAWLRRRLTSTGREEPA